jgi:urease accessory protein UreE
MPVIKCNNGKWRIGSGDCIYDTEEKAIEVYQAILAGGEFVVDSRKVSFDFDDTLSTQKGQDIALRLKREGKTLYIITRRQSSMSGEVFKVADKIGIPHSRVYFTNGKMKWETIKRLNIGIHYDNNQDEIDLINKNTQCRAIKF